MRHYHIHCPVSRNKENVFLVFLPFFFFLLFSLSQCGDDDNLKCIYGPKCFNDYWKLFGASVGLRLFAELPASKVNITRKFMFRREQL